MRLLILLFICLASYARAEVLPLPPIVMHAEDGDTTATVGVYVEPGEQGRVAVVYRVFNGSQTRIIEFPATVWLEDEHGNRYEQRGHGGQARMRPGVTIHKQAIFEPPIAAAESLKVEILTEQLKPFRDEIRRVRLTFPRSSWCAWPPASSPSPSAEVPGQPTPAARVAGQATP